MIRLENGAQDVWLAETNFFGGFSNVNFHGKG